mgnify:CR=1 FL=1
MTKAPSTPLPPTKLNLIVTALFVTGGLVYGGLLLGYYLVNTQVFHYSLEVNDIPLHPFGTTYTEFVQWLLHSGNRFGAEIWLYFLSPLAMALVIGAVATRLLFMLNRTKNTHNIARTRPPYRPTRMRRT